MANTRGVFRLNIINEEKIPLNEWVDLDEVWHGTTRFSDGEPQVELADKGYVTSGYASPQPGVRTYVTTLSTDTTSYVPGANMPSVRQNAATTSSLTVGYLAGGGPNDSNGAFKFPYSSNSCTFLPSVNIVSRSELCGNGNVDKGYFSGGVGPPPYNKYSHTYKLTYSNDNPSQVPGAALTQARRAIEQNGLSNLTHGHISGGDDASNGALSSTDRLTFSTETTAAMPGANLISSVPGYTRLVAFGNSSSGYAVVASGTVMKIVYSSGTFALNPGAATGTQRSQGTGFSGNVGGYMTGGETPATSPARSTNFQRLNYSTDTTVTLPSSANLGGFKYSGANGFSAFDTGNENREPPAPTPSPSTTGGVPNIL